jgi:Zn-dependent peptidase ImmA (M78 family)/transcriptional regulator with XRE-family HTH domain
MTIGVQAFQGERLKEARLSRGMFKKTLGDLIGVSGTAITRYEEGEDKPQRDKLELLASHLGFSAEFFLRPAWGETLELIFWRSRAAESKQAREMTEQRMRWACETFSLLEQEVNFPVVALPEMSLPDDFRVITDEMVEAAAGKVRRHWNLHDFPIPDATLALENAGVPVINLDIPTDKQDGFCFWSPLLDRPFVGINTYCVSACRARYDVAHELGHLILHKRSTPQHERAPVSKRILERQAHRFAGAFLFPRSSFLREVGYPSLDYFCDLKRRWGISIGAMVFRAHNLGMIGDAEKTALYRGMSRRGWRGPLQEPFDRPTEMPQERPRMLRRGIETMLRENTFDRPMIKSALELPQKELEQIAGITDGLLSPSTVVEFTTPARKRALTAPDLESGNVLEFPERQQK